LSWRVGLFDARAKDTDGQQLSRCLRDALRQFFPQMTVQGNGTYSPIDNARFKPGIPGWAKAGGHLPFTVSPKAITLGLYDIYYDPTRVSIDGGNNESLQTIDFGGCKWVENWAKKAQRRRSARVRVPSAPPKS